jgi:hypothetical protein
MKKLTNLFEAVAKVDSTKYPNLEFTPLNGSNPGSDSINDVLLQDLNTAAGNAKIKVNVTTAVSGHDTKTDSGNLSRHPGGFAVDIAMINGAGITKELGDALVAELTKLGYTHSPQENSDKHILWQTKAHYNHVHVSNKTNTAGGSGSTNTNLANADYDPTTTDDEFYQAAKTISRSYGQPMADKLVNPEKAVATESVSNKQKRILENIQKIKRLL